MKTYTMCSLRQLMDKETHKFLPIENKPAECEIDVPWYLGRQGRWEDDGTRFAQPGIKLIRKYRVEFNQMSVHFMRDYEYAKVRFFDSHINTERILEIHAKPSGNIYGRPGKQKREMHGVNYRVECLDWCKTFYTEFERPHENRAFNWITTLGHHGDDEGGIVSDKCFSYGVVDIEYSVIYKGRLLGGKTLAMICGPWAVLLDDEFRFDSLVTLTALKSYEMTVDRFVYTVNPYITKMIVLMG